MDLSNNVAVCYIGYHSGYIDTNKINGKIRNVDWKIGYENQLHTLKTLLPNSTIDYYIASYHSEEQDMLLSTYKPIASSFSILKGKLLTDGAYGRLCNIEKIFNMLDESGKKYDNIVFLRFDILFTGELDIKHHCFNVTFLNYDGITMDDIFTFSVLPGKYYETLKCYILSDSIRKRFACGGYNNHLIYNEFVKTTNIPVNIMIHEGEYKRSHGWLVGINPIYFLQSQMGISKCILCYNDIGPLPYITPCGCVYHEKCYKDLCHNNVDKCVTCRNNRIISQSVIN